MVTNYLSPASFVVSVSRLPNVEFFAQRVSIPSVSGSPVLTDNPLHAVYNTPDRLEYDDLSLSFIVDENMNNYKEILDWITGITAPTDLDQYKLTKNSSDGIKSDITVIISNSHKNPNIKFTFKDCFPVSLGTVELDVTAQDIAVVTSDVTFRYDSFIFEKI